MSAAASLLLPTSSPSQSAPLLDSSSAVPIAAAVVDPGAGAVGAGLTSMETDAASVADVGDAGSVGA